jgi:alpha-L-fucosidase
MQLTRHLVRCIVGIGGTAGHFTINIGPKGDGSVPEGQAKPLRQIGNWLKKNGDSIYGAKNSPIWPLHLGWGASCKDDTLFVHVMFRPGKEMCVAGIKNKVLRTYMLATGKELPFEQKEDRLFVRGLPSKAPDPTDTVIAIELDGPPEAVPETFWKD